MVGVSVCQIRKHCSAACGRLSTSTSTRRLSPSSTSGENSLVIADAKVTGEAAQDVAGRSLGGADGLVGRPLVEVERFYIEQALELVDGKREDAAALLGIGERTLYRKIKEYGLNQ